MQHSPLCLLTVYVTKICLCLSHVNTLVLILALHILMPGMVGLYQPLEIARTTKTDLPLLYSNHTETI